MTSATDRLFSVEGKVALVTGGSRGIGRMIARGLLAGGARVLISARKADACDAAAAELSAEAGVDAACVSLPEDVSGLAGATRLAERVAERTPALHILVNNAGTTWGASLEDYPDEAIDKVWGVNVKGGFHLTRLLLPQLRAAARPDDPARVINVGSIDGLRVPSMENYAYSATKAAVHMLTRHLAKRLACDNITVNAIAPGPFESKMMAFLLDDDDSRRAMESAVPLGRIGDPDDMAGVALYLSSRAGAYVTGAVVVVDGGLSL
jgi:NAD(P)-dependent dehydrogenase (short-subunit alcohol dehydrogenase family)